jgi:long-chain acyl-CoA synthetase
MIKKVFIFSLLVAASFSRFAEARMILDVNVPETKTVDGQELKLNGAGVRTVFVIKVKAYVAAFYAPAALATAEAVRASGGPLKFDFTFLRSVSQSRVTDAWTSQFEASNSYPYAGFEKDRDAFIKMFGPLKKGGVESVEIIGDETRIYDDGQLRGTIKGKEFQKSFLSLWFGDKPVLPSLKKNLLGQDS